MKPRAKNPPPRSPQSDPVAPDILGEHDGVTFKRERLAPILRELIPMIEQDWCENGINHEQVPLQLNLPQYLDYDLLGVLQIVTAREDDLLVGFMFAFVHPHIMHSGLGWCLINLYYLYPEYRGSGTGSAMLRALEKFLQSARVRVIEGSEKVEHESGLFERNGYKATDKVWRKLLEG